MQSAHQTALLGEYQHSGILDANAFVEIPDVQHTGS
jgi:hypothetical protein